MPRVLRDTPIRKKHRFKAFRPATAFARFQYAGLNSAERLLIFETLEQSRLERAKFHSIACAELRNAVNRGRCNVCFPTGVYAGLPLSCQNCNPSFCERSYPEVYAFNQPQWQWRCRLWAEAGDVHEDGRSRDWVEQYFNFEGVRIL